MMLERIESVNMAYRSQIEAALAAHGLTQVGEMGRYFHVDGLSDDWHLSWTGWKCRDDDGMFYAQWLAYHKDRRGYFASIPGIAGKYVSGGNFDVQRQDGQGVLTQQDLDRSSCEHAMNKSQALMTEALGRLLAAMEQGELGAHRRAQEKKS